MNANECIPTPQEGVYKPENFVKFSQKYTPYPRNYFCENGFPKIVQLMNINEFVVILKSINFKNGKLKNINFENFQIQWLKNFSLS